jgi:hypothetical protein
MRLAWFDNILYDAQPSNRQFINLQRAKAGLFDYQTPDSEPANRQRADGKRAKGCRAQRKRQYAGRGKGLGSSRYFARQLAGSMPSPYRADIAWPRTSCIIGSVSRTSFPIRGSLWVGFRTAYWLQVRESSVHFAIRPDNFPL